MRRRVLRPGAKGVPAAGRRAGGSRGGKPLRAELEIRKPKSESRNPKLEIRNKFKARMTEDQNDARCHWVLRICFGLRASNFVLRVCSPYTDRTFTPCASGRAGP